MASAEEVYDVLIAPIEEQMMRTVARIVRDPDRSADAFQNALEQIWKNLKKIYGHPNPRGYILRICINASYDMLRRNSHQRLTEIPSNCEDKTDSSENAVISLIRREEELRIMGSITCLPRKQAQAFLLRALEDQSFESIGQILGCSEATARSHFSKGKVRLRNILTDLNPQKAKEPKP